MPEYFYNNQPISEDRVISAAENLGLSIDEYLEKYKFETKEPEVDEQMDDSVDRVLSMFDKGDESLVEEKEEKVKPSKFNNFFTEVNPTAVDNASTRVIDPSKFDIGGETINNFMSDESFEDLHKQYPGVKFNKVGLGNGTITVKLPGQKSSRPFEVPSDDEGLGRLKFEIADYIENKQETFFKPDSNVESEIDRIWNEHSKKWDAEDLMSEELGKLLGSDYVVETSGTLGNEFTVIKDKGKGASIDIRVGGADKYGNNQSSDVLKRFLTQGQRSFEDTPEYYEDKKEITEIVNKNYLNNPVKLNEIFEKNNITNFSNIATPENKEALVQHVLSDQNALGGILNAARTNFDNLTNIDIDEIVTGVVDSYVTVEWDAIAEKDANTELKQLKEQGYTPLQIEDIYHKQHSASFSVFENNIKNKLIEIDRADPAKKENLQLELDGFVQEYIEEGGANYDVLFDMGTGKLAPSVSDAKNENIINLKDLVQDQMANYEGLTREELKFEFLRTAAALSEFEDKTKEIKGTGTGRYAAPFAKYNKGLFGQYQRDDYDVLLAQKAELLSKMEGLKRTYLLNERLETVDKSNLGGLVQQAGRSFVTSFGDDPNTAIINNGVTEAQTVAAIKDIYQEMNIPLNRAAREHSKTSTADMVAEGLGGLPRVVIEFGGYGKIINGVKYLTGVNRWVQSLGMSRYKQGEKLIDESKVIKKVNKWAKKKNMDAIEGKGLNLSTTELSTIGAFVASNSNKGKKAIQIIGPSTINKAKIKAVGALTEGTVFSLVEKDIEGMPKGIAFNLAGGVIPGFNKLAPSIQKRLNSMKALYDGNAMGMRMMVGNKAGEAFNALIKDVSGHQEWQTFLKENYDDPDMIMGGLITDYVLGAALAVPHAKLLGPGGFDRMTYNKIVDAKGKFGEKLNEYIEYDANGNARIKKGKEAEFDKWNDLHTEAQRRMWELDGLADYNNPLLAPSLAKKEVKGVEKANKDILKEEGLKGIDVVWKTEGETGRRGGFVINKKTGKIEIELDPNHLTPGLVSHEIHHPLYKIAMKNKNVKAASIRKLLELTKDIKLRENLSLYNAIKDKGIASLEDMDLAKVQEAELFAYISQSIRDGAKIEGVNKSNGWARLKKWIDSSIGREVSKKEARLELQTRTKNDIVNWFGEYHKNIGEGGPSLVHFKKLTELVDKWTPYGKEMETTKPGEIGIKTIGSTKGDFISLDAYGTMPKQKGLSSQVLVNNKGVPIDVKVTEREEQDFNSLLQKLAVKSRDPKDIKKLESLRKIDPDKVAPEMREKLEKDILDLEAPSNIYDIINMYDPAISSNAGTGRLVNAMNRRFNTPSWPFMEDIVKDFLTGKRGIKGLAAEYNRKVKNGDIDPAKFPLGKFIGGKFDVRFQESVDKIGKKEFEKSKDAEGMKETEYKDTWMEDFETQDLSIKRRLEREKWLEDKGLTEETAESYIAEQNLITLSKELGLKDAKSVVEKAQATIPELKRNLEPQRPGESKKDYNKRIVSHKNSIDQYRKSIEKDIIVDYFNVSEATYNKMSVVGKEGQALKTAMAWQIKGTEKKPGDLQAVKKVVEANVPTILTAISKGAQNKIDPIYLTEIAPDIVKGKSSGVPKVLLHNELLFTPTSKRQQTAAGLQPFIQSEGFIKYQKTKDSTYKTEFERKFAESLKSPQDYKAVMQEVGKNVYLQSVRSALPAESALARQLEAGKNEGLASERLLNDQIIKDRGKFKASLSGINKLFKSSEYDRFSQKDKDNFLDKYAEKLDAAKGKSEVELMVETTPTPKVEMKAIETKNNSDMVDKLVKDFGGKGEFAEGLKKEGMDDWSSKSTKKATQDLFEVAIANQYPVGAESIIIKNAGNGKNNNWNFSTKQYERIAYPKGKEKTIQNWMNHNLGGEVFTGNGKKITDTKIINGKEVGIYDFFRESVTKETGDFKTRIANEVVAATNAGKTKSEIKEIVWKVGRELVAGKTKDINKVIEANIKKRQFHMDAIKHVIENHADYGLTRQEAVQAAVRHVRRHTNITDGSIKGTATITAGSMEVGIPVGKDPFAKNFLGSMYHAEHQMQLQNHTYTFFNSLGRNWNKKTKSFNNKRYKEEMDILSKLFEQSTTVKQDQLIYDSPLFGGNTTYLKAFASKNLGEVSSILNILYQKGVSGSIVDFKSKTPKTIAESIMDSYNQKQLDILLKESTKLGEANSLHYELSSMNKGRKAVEAQNLKIAKRAGLPIVKNAKPSEVLASMRISDKAVELGRKRKKESRGMSTFDFDETLVIGGKNFVTATKGKETKKISSEKFPIDGPKLAEQGWKFDFKDFVNVKGGKEGPLMQKLKNQIAKYGNENVFVLTARMQEAAPAIHAWLKSKGVDIPLENITGLGNSTGEAKAMWMLKKFSEGYNDMYFVDDALPNVKAVRDVLNQLDIKSKVQQALASTKLDIDVNKIMEHSLDIKSEKKFSKAEAKVRGKDIKRRRIFMRDSAADLELLIEPLYGKGKKGIENKKWFKKEFVMPFERGIRDYNTARQSAKNDYMNLRKQNKDVVKQISKEVEGTTFTNDMAMRVYLWNKAGYKIPDLAKTTEAKLVEHIRNNPKLQAYAEQFARITKQEKGLKEPGENWWAETMAGEVTNINRGVSRTQYLQEWIDVKNEIFTEVNLNKMESKLGTRWRENIEDMFDRMETGRTRSLKMDRGSAMMMNYLNGSIGSIMNFNTRSAALQTISTVNFLNMRENNPIAAARTMGNTKQFVKDFKYIMNSDMLKQRRDGLAMNVTEAELASAAASSKNPIQSMIAKVLKHGYLPTKMADSFAISFGGATFYRNRIKMYEKQGMKTKEAEKQAWLDFQVLSERTQQSSRADLLSKQQTSLIGRFILPFANTPMQMNRAGMKDILDLSKGRYKDKIEAAEKMGRITYYMGAQISIFAGLQSAMFALMLNDDDVPEKTVERAKTYALGSTTDSFLRGFGVPGAVLSALKNATLEYAKQSKKPGFTADYSEVGEALLNISPPIGSKFGKLDRAGDMMKWAKIRKEDEFKFKLGNPSLQAGLLTIEAITNAPLHGWHQNAFNIQHALSDDYEMWQRAHMLGGWTPFQVGIESEKKKKKKKRTGGYRGRRGLIQ